MQLLRFAHPPATVRLGDLEVRRLGFGVGDLAPDDRASAHAVLRRAVELGANVILAAADALRDALIIEALSPYPGDLALAAHVGGWDGDTGWKPALRADDLRAAVDHELRTLGVEQLQIALLRWTEQPDVSFAEALDGLRELQRTGKVRHIGLSDVTLDQLDTALAAGSIVAVEATLDPELLAACERHSIAFVPVVPTAPHAPTSSSSTVDLAARHLGCTPAQLVIASLLARSPVILPFATASKVVQVEEHLGAVHVAVDDQTLHELAA